MSFPGVGSIIERIRQLYKRREGQLVPFPWCDDLSFNLNEIFTRLKIVNKEKTRGTLTDDEITNMTAVFRPHPDCQKPRILLIEGEPGMGKTTYSQKLAYDWANEQDEWDPSFPSIEVLLLLRCNDIKSGIWEAIDDQLLPDDIGKEAKEDFLRFIRENQENVLLLLDGLDEADSRKLDMYYSLVQSKLLASCHIVITSRHEVGKKVRPYCDTLWEIVGFTKEDAESFIRKYFKDKGHLAEKLRKRLTLPWYWHDDQLGNLDELAKNPLNTALLCCLFEDFEGVLPASRTQLYVEIVLFVLRRYEEKRGLESSREDLISVYRKELLLLGSFAFESLLQGELHFEKKEEIVKSINFGFFSFQKGGTKRKPCTRCAFLHKSFQEFFAGFYLAFQIINKQIDCASVVADERYLNELNQVFLFMGGYIASQSQETAVTLAASLTGHINSLLNSDKRRNFIYLTCKWLSECSSVKETLKDRLVCTIGSNLDLPSANSGHFYECGINDAFAAAISQVLTRTSFLTELSLFENNIGNPGAIHLSQALKANSSLTSLILMGNSIGDSGASSLFQALTANSSLTELDLNRNSIGDDGLSCLSQALTAFSSLTELDLSKNSIGDAGASYLSKALTARNSSLTFLDLSSNSIGDAGASCLSQALTGNSSLDVLDLNSNSIGYAGAFYLLQALTANSSLTDLSLKGNRISDAGAFSPSQVLPINSSLTFLSLSHNSIGDNSAYYLSQALTAFSFLSKLDLPGNNIGVAGACYLFKALTANSSHTKLDLCNNSIGDAGASCLCHAFTANSSLAGLGLTDNFIGDTGASCLSKALKANYSLNDLNLCSNSIGDAGASCLAKALAVNSSLTCLNLDENSIGDAGASCLAKALTVNSYLTRLNLDKNSIGDAGASCLAQSLTANSSLKCLDLRYNSIGYAGACCLAQALGVNSSLTYLNLHENSIGDAGASRLAQALGVNSSLTHLNLDENSIGDAGASCLALALEVNSSLTYLNLDENRIGDDGASCLAQALTANSSLKYLGLRCNSIGDAGASCLAKALTVNSSLTCLTGLDRKQYWRRWSVLSCQSPQSKLLSDYSVFV